MAQTAKFVRGIQRRDAGILPLPPPQAIAESRKCLALRAFFLKIKAIGTQQHMMSR
jgi:hypothetical protein